MNIQKYVCMNMYLVLNFLYRHATFTNIDIHWFENKTDYVSISSKAVWNQKQTIWKTKVKRDRENKNDDIQK